MTEERFLDPSELPPTFTRVMASGRPSQTSLADDAPPASFLEAQREMRGPGLSDEDVQESRRAYFK